MKVDLLPHNLETYMKVQKEFKTTNKTCVVQPTGSGKSFLMLQLIEDYINLGREIIVIEPQRYIFDQLKKKMDKYEIDKEKITFLTYSALGKMDNGKLSTYNDPCLVIVDEMHRAGAAKWGIGLQLMFEHFPSDCKYLGLSATPIRYLDQKRDMSQELFDGCIANEISLTDAIIKRILPLPRYVAGLYSYDYEIKEITRKIQQSCNSEDDKNELLNEVKLMKKNLDKSKGVSDIFKKYMVGERGKYVAFCRNIKHLAEMRACLETWFTEAGIKANIYEVHCKNPEKNEQFQAFKNDTGLAVCLSIAMLSEGIHGIDGVILLRDTISPNLYYQQIGRAFACNMESIPIIFDLVANCNSIMECSLKNDLLEAVEKREKERKEKCAGNDGSNEDRNEITREDIENFFVFDQVVDAISAFKSIEGRLKDGWDIYIRALEQYKEREGDCDVPAKHVEIVDGTKLNLGGWIQNVRKSRNENGTYSMTSERLQQLIRLGFVWDSIKYRFERAIAKTSQFKIEHGNYPSTHSENKYEKSLGIFRNNERHKKHSEQDGKTYPLWKMEIIEKYEFFDFFEGKESRIKRFCRMALVFEKVNGHINIKRHDKINSYNIGSVYNTLMDDYKNNKISQKQAIEIKEKTGIDITQGKFERMFNEKMELAKQALKEGVVISNTNQFFKGVNMYKWYRKNRNKFSQKELEITAQLISMKGVEKPVKVIDIINNNKEMVFPSRLEAANALINDYHVVENKCTAKSAIDSRITGKTKSPYKKRFLFEAVDMNPNPTQQSQDNPAQNEQQ